MTPWPKYPVIYEINTWVWLQELGRREGCTVTLADVPEDDWEAIGALGVDAVWLMGVWERSPEGIRIANQNRDLLADFRRALPDFTEADNVGSPYCVRRYAVDGCLGGPDGLAVARQKLARRGIRLILDFVPNHVAPDHLWTREHPEYFISGSERDLAKAASSFLEAGGHVLACGKDPYFPAWPDVVQLNAFNPALREAVADTLLSIARQCDGVRCDMAMLVMNQIFERTWGDRAGPRPYAEYWQDLIGSVKGRYPDFLFMAESYWDLEWELQEQGFDLCYDKRLYDRLEHDSAEMVRLHLLADLSYQRRLVRFIENHDEPRAAAVFPPLKQRAAAVAFMTLPGAKLLHEGQLQGRKVRLPVFLGRRPDEPPERELESFYMTLLRNAQSPVFREGNWRLCERSGWPDNASFLNLVAWCWRDGEERRLIIINLSRRPSQARVQVPWDDLAGASWSLADAFSGEVFERDGDEMGGPGFFVDLPPWGFHFFECTARRGSEV